MSVQPLHMGAVHAIEWVLSIALVAGPLLALGIVILVVRRREDDEDDDTDPGSG